MPEILGDDSNGQTGFGAPNGVGVADLELDENKQPRAKVNVRMLLTEPGDRTHSTKFIAYATTDDTGNFTSEPLYPGNYLIEENVVQYPVLGEVEVRANQTTKL